jgi:hypothetical protein
MVPAEQRHAFHGSNDGGNVGVGSEGGIVHVVDARSWRQTTIASLRTGIICFFGMFHKLLCSGGGSCSSVCGIATFHAAHGNGITVIVIVSIAAAAISNKYKSSIVLTVIVSNNTCVHRRNINCGSCELCGGQRRWGGFVELAR